MIRKIQISKLKELLSKCNEKHFVQCNQVGGLAVTDEQERYLGFIELLAEELVLFDEREIKEDTNDEDN